MNVREASDHVVKLALDGVMAWALRIAYAARHAQAEAGPVQQEEVTITVNVDDAKEAHRLLLVLQAAVRDCDHWSDRRGDAYLDDEIPF